MTRNNASSLSGLTGAVCRKASSPVYPQVGHFFCNLPDLDQSVPPSPSDPMTIHLKDLCRAMASGLGSLQLKAQPLYRTASHEPINLYHKVGNTSNFILLNEGWIKEKERSHFCVSTFARLPVAVVAYCFT